MSHQLRLIQLVLQTTLHPWWLVLPTPYSVLHHLHPHPSFLLSTGSLAQHLKNDIIQRKTVWKRESRQERGRELRCSAGAKQHPPSTPTPVTSQPARPPAGLPSSLPQLPACCCLELWGSDVIGCYVSHHIWIVIDSVRGILTQKQFLSLWFPVFFPVTHAITCRYTNAVKITPKNTCKRLSC